MSVTLRGHRRERQYGDWLVDQALAAAEPLPLPAWVTDFNHEQFWRAKGTLAINEEMERRLAVYFTVRLVDRLKRRAAPTQES